MHCRQKSGHTLAPTCDEPLGVYHTQLLELAKQRKGEGP